jgi:hypothetical protein
VSKQSDDSDQSILCPNSIEKEKKSEKKREGRPFSGLVKDSEGVESRVT